jgi:DMSO/TMAO reductase YedYZ molybdopterin-dependent catalytic subunit
VTLRDNPGVLSGGRTGTLEAGLDLTVTERFAASMTLEEALAPTTSSRTRCTARPSPRARLPGTALRPGWYGVANVKWLTAVELQSERFAGRFMTRDYVTGPRAGPRRETTWTFTTVGKDRLKSAPARVTRTGDRTPITGAAWGAPVSRVEVSIDGGRSVPPGCSGSCRAASTAGASGPTTGAARAGEHTVRSRAFDTAGAVQPWPGDGFLTSRRTFWEANGQITRRVRTA